MPIASIGDESSPSHDLMVTACNPRDVRLNHAATALCSHRKASHFWQMLLLISGTADYWNDLASRSAVLRRRGCGACCCSSSAKKSQAPNFAQSPKICASPVSTSYM
jgi:hypothetical protein